MHRTNSTQLCLPRFRSWAALVRPYMRGSSPPRSKQMTSVRPRSSGWDWTCGVHLCHVVWLVMAGNGFATSRVGGRSPEMCKALCSRLVWNGWVLRSQHRYFPQGNRDMIATCWLPHTSECNISNNNPHTLLESHLASEAALEPAPDFSSSTVHGGTTIAVPHSDDPTYANWFGTTAMGALKGV